MDKREFHTKQCRYYKGEPQNPYQRTDAKFILWELERHWVELEAKSNTQQLFSYVAEYNAAGLGQYASNNKTPLRLRALLLNRFYAQSGHIPYGATEFKQWFEKYY